MKENVLKSTVAAALFAAIMVRAGGPDAGSGTLPEIVGVENAVLTEAPHVPPPITRKQATKVIVSLEVKEITKRLADNVDYTFWTFGGNVPGSFIRIREGDLVEFHLQNNQNNKLPHNIDLHAVTGPGGGAAASFTAPGHASQFSFRALNPGLYVYHCATAPVGMHVANGMYGLILVEPKEGLPPVDQEYYLMQGEFYTAGKFGDSGLQAFDMDKAVDERPPYVVFNGAVGALTDTNALVAAVGKKVRLYVGNGGPNLDSSFHVVGNIFDTVYPDGGTTPIHNIQTVLVPAGGAAMVDFQPKVPGAYALVDHSIFRAFNKGAIGTLNVTGGANDAIFSGKQSDTLFSGESITNPAPQPQLKSSPPVSASPAAKPMDLGHSIYMQACFVCHQPDGKGVGSQIPPLAGSDFLMGDKSQAIRTVIQGRTGEVTVNGRKFVGTMIPVGSALSDEQIASVLTYARNAWGNQATAVTPAEVHAVREATAPLAAKTTTFE